MQLPRGKFRELVRAVPLSPLLLELNELQYTGVISLTWDRSGCTLVFQEGTIILAEYPPLKGDPAWDAVSRLGDQPVSAILTDLDPMQMKLAGEFNGPCILSRPVRFGKGAPVPKEPVTMAAAAAAIPVQPRPAPARAPAPAPRSQEPAAPARDKPPSGGAAGVTRARPPVTPLPTREVAPRRGPAPVPAGAPQAPPARIPPAEQVPERHLAGQPGTGVPEDDEPAPPAMDPQVLASMEMAALDEMDVDHIATKIRKNARGIVKKLHLGHLMTEKDE